MLRRLIFTIAAVMMIGSWHLSLAATCPDYTALEQTPTLPTPEKESFDHFGSRLISSLYTPYHMVHDALVTEGNQATVVGKFDYDIALHKDLEDETVYAYLYGTGMNSWEFLGTYTTDSDGKVYVDAGKRAAGEYTVYMVVAGDLSTATGYLSVIEPGSDAILFDIDGTLTLTDFEEVGDYLGISTAKAYNYATDVVNAYKNKNYRIIYVTGRPYWLAKDSREWLALKQIPMAHLHTNPNGEIFQPSDVAVYKGDYIRQLIDSGVNIVRAYGNATTDIEAYADAGIAKSNTYIIGKHAGEEGTQALGEDYSEHYATVVANTPVASCSR
ncbi:hypothetical protein SBX37_00690 [Vibrio mangrovi]|nr:haloacid dehalogenase [Vibrio mangrovi]MDW6001426.1 hypothetical protein [Vibrio mangrovi]